ncbi:MAG: hypothetical protein ACK4WH_05190 [Phycisphaerales bacterium]
MATKILNKWGFTNPITTDAAILASFEVTLGKISDEANKRLNDLDASIEQIRTSRAYTPTGKLDAAYAAAKQAITDFLGAVKGPRKVIADAINKAAALVPTAAQLPRPENVWIGGDARIVEDRAREIRKSLSEMDPSQRSAAFVVGARELDHELIWSIVGAPLLVRKSLFPDASAVEATVGSYLARRFPDQFAALGTARNAKLIADGLVGQMIAAAKDLSGSPARFEGPGPDDLSAMLDAAYTKPPLRLDPSSGAFEPFTVPAAAVA